MKTSSFNIDEANEMLQLCYAVDLLGPMSKVADNANFPPDVPANTRPNIRDIGSTAQIDPVRADNPLYADDKSFYNYPTTIWPEGWGPAIPLLSEEKDVAHESDGITPFNKWFRSRATSFAPDWYETGRGDGMNCVLACRKKGTNIFAIAIAGTENLLGGIEDAFMIPVPTGPLKAGTEIGWGKISFPLPVNLNADFTIKTAPYNTVDPVTADQPPLITPSMHFGFRAGLETLFDPLTTKGGYTLKHIIAAIDNIANAEGLKDIEIMVTGHSLGGGLCGVFTTWLLANNPFTKTNANIKAYSFASPKVGNDAFAYAYDMALTNYGRSYRVANCLDTIPQVPFTLEGLKTLNNPDMIKMLANMSKITKEILEATFGYEVALNYCHVGYPVIIPGEYPVVWNKTTYPISWSKTGQDAHKIPSASLQLTQEWWQHWPGNYAEALNKLQLDSTPTTKEVEPSLA